MLRRVSLAAVMIALTGSARTQTVDSAWIFTSIPQVKYTTSLAETTGWHLLRERASRVTIGSDQLADLNKSLGDRRPVKHHHADLPGLSHIGFVYYDKRAHVFCLSQDEGLVVDLTARRQFLMDDWTDRVKLKAALMALGL